MSEQFIMVSYAEKALLRGLPLTCLHTYEALLQCAPSADGTRRTTVAHLSQLSGISARQIKRDTRSIASVGLVKFNQTTGRCPNVYSVARDFGLTVWPVNSASQSPLENEQCQSVTVNSASQSPLTPSNSDQLAPILDTGILDTELDTSLGQLTLTDVSGDRSDFQSSETPMHPGQGNLFPTDGQVDAATNDVAAEPANGHKTGNGKCKPEDVLAAWNEMAAANGLPTARDMTDKRRAAIRERLAKPFWREHWREALALIPSRGWMLGANDRGWRANLDYFLRPGSVTSIVEAVPDDAPVVGWWTDFDLPAFCAVRLQDMNGSTTGRDVFLQATRAEMLGRRVFSDEPVELEIPAWWPKSVPEHERWFADHFATHGKQAMLRWLNAFFNRKNLMTCPWDVPQGGKPVPRTVPSFIRYADRIQTFCEGVYA